MRMILVSPNTAENSLFSSTARLPFFAAGDPVARLAPLAVATIAGLTPSIHDVEIHDENIRGPVEQQLREHRYDIIGMSVLDPQLGRALEICRYCSENAITGVRVIGGLGATATGKTEYANVDVVFLGEAEETWPRFLQDAERGQPRCVYQQVSKPDLSNSPVPRWELIKDDLHLYRAASVQSTRGCPHDCHFCDVISFFGRRRRHKPVDRVLEEIRLLESLGVDSIFITDDNFVGETKYTKELLRRLVPLNNSFRIPIQFTTQATITMADDPELLGLMADANFLSVLVGVESPRVEALRDLNKHQNLRRDIRCAINEIQSYGIVVMATFILASDTDDETSFGYLADFLKEANIADAQGSLLLAPPGTRIWYRVKQEGRLLDLRREGHESVEGSDVPDPVTNIIPKRMSRVAALESYADYLDTVHHPFHYVERAVGLIRNVKRAPRVNKSLLPTLIKKRRLFIRMFVYFLFKAPPEHRKVFLKVVGTALRHSPFMLPQAFFLSFRFLERNLVNKHLAGLARERARYERLRPEGVEVMAPSIPIPQSVRDHSKEIIGLAYKAVRERVDGQETLCQAVVESVSDYVQRWGTNLETFDDHHSAHLVECCERVLDGLRDDSSAAIDDPALECPPPGFVREIMNEVDRKLRGEAAQSAHRRSQLGRHPHSAPRTTLAIPRPDTPAHGTWPPPTAEDAPTNPIQ